MDEPFDFVSVIDDAVQVYRAEAERRGIQFTVSTAHIPNLVVGNAKKIRTIVANLTANAGEYQQPFCVTLVTFVVFHSKIHSARGNQSGCSDT